MEQEESSSLLEAFFHIKKRSCIKDDQATLAMIIVKSRGNHSYMIE